MDNLRKLEEIFSHFPGIGPRQAHRFVYHIMNKSTASVRELAELLEKVKGSTYKCKSCQRLFTDKTSSSSSICQVCSDNSRNMKVVMVVARDTDYESIEKSGAYKGMYFILGGLVPILDNEPDKRIRLTELLKKIDKEKAIEEVVLSLAATPDGEHTAEIIKVAISAILGERNVKMTVLGRGLSTGAELEYVDGETIKNALYNRR